MRGIIHNSVVGRDEEVNGVTRKAFYLLSDLPQGEITEDALHHDGYKTIEAEHNRKKVKIVASVNSRKFLVIDGIPFYASSGTSDDQSVISPAWRKNIWMPFMGYAGHGSRRGRIAKLGDQCSSEFKTFIDSLVNKWAEDNSADMASDEKMKLMYKPNNREGYIRGKANDDAGTLGDLKTQLCRFGHVRAFAIAMQLLPEDAWCASASPESQESFESLRSLRDYFLEHYQSEYAKLSNATLEEVKVATFKEYNENFHVLEEGRGGQLQLASRKLRFIRDEARQERVIREDAKEAHEINRQLRELGANTEYLGRLNNPRAPTHLTMRLSALFLRLHEHTVKVGRANTWKQADWDKGIDEIFDQLMPLEQFLDLEEQKNRYKEKFQNFLSLSTSVSLFSSADSLSSVKMSVNRMIEPIGDIDSICTKENLSVVICEMTINYYHLQYLNSLVSVCLPNIKMNNPAYHVLQGLNQVISDKTSLPPKRVKDFYDYLLENDYEKLKILKNDNSRHTKALLKGICVLAATFLTGMLPGLIAMGIVYAVSGKAVTTFFKPHKMGLEFSDKVDSAKQDLLNTLQSNHVV